MATAHRSRGSILQKNRSIGNYHVGVVMVVVMVPGQLSGSYSADLWN